MGKYLRFTGTDSEYRALHYWVERQLGCPSLCANCGTTKAKKFNWANISGTYKKEITDWKRLCASCHLKEDRGNLCRKGLHEITGDNVYLHPGAGSRCRECKRQYRADYRRRNGK